MTLQPHTWTPWYGCFYWRGTNMNDLPFAWLESHVFYLLDEKEYDFHAYDRQWTKTDISE